jgi:LPS export ABC transporter protein LptC
MSRRATASRAPETERSRAVTRAAPGVVLLVAALLGVACRETGKQPGLTTPAADSADQIMYGAKSVLTDRGLMRAELIADTAYFYDENTRIEMRQVHLTFFTQTGVKNAVLTSREGTYNTRLGNMEARGDVVVVSEDGRRLTTPQLRYAQARNEISSDSTFTLKEPGRTLEGIGFTSDPNLNTVRCLRACRGAGAITLPSQ